MNAATTPAKTVLVVDDEQDILDLVRFRLEHDGYRVITATDGQAGLALAQTEQPDLCSIPGHVPSRHTCAERCLLEIGRWLLQEHALRLSLLLENEACVQR